MSMFTFSRLAHGFNASTREHTISFKFNNAYGEQKVDFTVKKGVRIEEFINNIAPAIEKIMGMVD